MVFIGSTIGCCQINNQSLSVSKNETIRQDNNYPTVFKLNSFGANDLQYNDISDNFYSHLDSIKQGNGGDVILANFLHLLYIEFLNPLAKNNPTLTIPAEPTNPEAFFVTHKIEKQPGMLQNHDGDTINSTWDDTAPSYPTTLAVVALLNILLVPLDTTPAFKQLAAQNLSGTFNPVNGFFSQFINYILTKQLHAMRGWNFYHRGVNGTSVNIGMFDFDTGYQKIIDRTSPGTYYTINIGVSNNGKWQNERLSEEINNFMFLLGSYVNFAASLLTNLTNIEPDPLGQWLMLNNLTSVGIFHTPKLVDAVSSADGWAAVYDDTNNGAATIFTGLPRFMINASYGNGPGTGQRSRDWGENNQFYFMTLHYNGLISGYLKGAQLCKDFVHSSVTNGGHYYAYNDTELIYNLDTEQRNIGEIVYWKAWNAQIQYLFSNDSDIFNTICMNTWYSSTFLSTDLPITPDMMMIQTDDKIGNAFTGDSIIKQLQKKFNSAANVKIGTFLQNFNSVQAIYSQYDYGFKVDEHNKPVVKKYVDLTTINPMTPQTLLSLEIDAKEFALEQKNIFNLKMFSLDNLYQTVNLGFKTHTNGSALQYPLPDLRHDDPKTHNCSDRAELYVFYALDVQNPTKTEYFNNFKLEQLSIQQEHLSKPQHGFPAWTIVLIIVSTLMTAGLFLTYYFWRSRKNKTLSTKKPTSLKS